MKLFGIIYILYKSIIVLMNFSIILFVYFAFNHGLLILLIRFLFHCLTRPGCFITHIIRLTRLRFFNKHLYLQPTLCHFSNFSYTTYLGSSMEVDSVSKRIGSYSVYSPKPCRTKQLRQSGWDKAVETKQLKQRYQLGQFHSIYLHSK